jgi:acyl-CoA synthetase (NDP forming)
MEPKEREALDKFFYPQSVAIIGASAEPKKTGYVWVKNFVEYGYKGKIYPINPKEDEILGFKAYKSVLDVPNEIDLVIFIVPAAAMVKIMEECVQKKIPAGIIHSAGYAETGKEGVLLQQKLVEMARQGGMKLIGPNCVGILCPESGHPWARRSTFPKDVGGVSVISQSGGGGGYFINMGEVRGIAFSKFISIGNECDVSVIDFMDYLRDDPKTNAVFVYLEGFRDGQRFLEVAKPLSRVKPVLVYKVGRTEVGRKMTASHTGSIAGSLAVYDGAFRQAGVLRVEDFEEAQDYLIAFENLWFGQGIPKGPRVGIIAGPGGPGVAAADTCGEVGLQVPAFSEETVRRLAEEIPGASRTNPTDIDLGAMAMLKGMNPFVVRANIIEADDNIDMLAFVGLGENNPKAALDAMLEIQATCKKPFIVVWPSAGKEVDACKEILQQKKVPLFLTPERGAKALGALMRYKKAVERLEKEDLQ